MRWYSKEGSEAFNREVDRILLQLGKDIEQTVGSPFLALILGGGYGRAEGACVRKDGKESLYNDLDLFLVTSTPWSLTREVHDIREKYEAILGIDVDIGAPITRDDLRRLPHELMWQDLMNGHIVIAGDPRILEDHVPQAILETIPAVEAIRLLLNRGSGLLQAIMEAQELLKDPEHRMPDPDFIRRNYQKAGLSFGDALTIAFSSYTVHLPDRLEHLRQIEQKLPESLFSRASAAYADAIIFKQRPDSFPPEQPSIEELLEYAGMFVELFLLVESTRTGRAYTSAEDYARDSFIRERSQHDSSRDLVRNLVKNLRRGRLSLRYPREGLYGMLVLLLAAPEPGSAGWQEQALQFLQLWKHYD